MVVDRTRRIAAAALVALAACTDPSLNTDLRPEGPPDVLAVLVMTDAVSQLSEKATFCRVNDDKRPSQVGLPDFTTSQVCPVDLSEPADMVTNAYPDGWYIRIMFDELLDPNIETLTSIDDEDGEPTGTFEGSIAGANPVKVQCQSMNGNVLTDVSYDGYYSPAGNRVTWPLGPSLVIKPNEPKLIATNTECQVTINDTVKDKQGESVPADQRGPFKFKVAPIQVLAIDPADDPMKTSPVDATQIYYDNIYMQFNTLVDMDSLCPDADGSGLCDDESVFAFKDDAHPTEGPGYCNVTFGTCGTIADCDTGAGDTVCGRGFCNNGFFDTTCNAATDCAAGETCETTYAYSLKPFGFSEAEFGLGPLNAVETGRSYTFGFAAGAKLKDRCGRESTITPTAEDMTLTHFTTNAFGFKKATLATGETASAMKKLVLSFTNVVGGGDVPGAPLATTTLDPAMWDLSPLPVASGGAALTKAQIQIVAPDFSGQIMFRGHLMMGIEYTFTLKAGAVVSDFFGKTYTNTADSVIKWKTAPAILNTSTTPVDNGTVTKATPASAAGVQINFNQAMDRTSLDATEFTVTDAGGFPVVMDGVANSSRGCATTSTSCGLVIFKTGMPEGRYKLTLKAGATIKDLTGSTAANATYTQAADKVINFTVVNAVSNPVQCL